MSPADARNAPRGEVKSRARMGKASILTLFKKFEKKPKKNQTFFQKPLDKEEVMWYTKQAVARK